MIRKCCLCSVVVFVFVLSCAPSEDPTDSTSSDGALTVVGTPVPHSQVATAFQKPLSSGLSVADITETALPSVAHVITSSGTGSGFVINEDGLIVTNEHVIGDDKEVVIRFANGNNHWGYVTQLDPILDLAYVQVLGGEKYNPMAIGNSDEIRVGENVITIGFPLSRELGLQPTVSVGIISAKRGDQLQTDASINPGSSGGPLLDMYGQVIGVVVSRIEADNSGRSIEGIGFAIPINAVEPSLGTGVSGVEQVVPTPTPTHFPTIGPTADLEATKAAIVAMDTHRRQAELATRTATQAQQEAERYAASLEATRIAEIPTPTPRPTPTPEPTPTPLPPTPTPTPHPATHCTEWEKVVLEWIRGGNNYLGWDKEYDQFEGLSPTVPSLANFSAAQGHKYCITGFPRGVMWASGVTNYGGTYAGANVGHGPGHYLPGTYQYRWEGGNRVDGEKCLILLNYQDQEKRSEVALPYGEPFSFTFYTYHAAVVLYDDRGSYPEEYQCKGALYRVGD